MSPREYRDLFAFKVTAFDQLVAEDRITLLHHYIDFARAHVRHLEAQARDLGENASSYGYSEAQGQRMSSVFDHLIDVWQDEARWAEALLSAEAESPAKRSRSKPRKA